MTDESQRQPVKIGRDWFNDICIMLIVGCLCFALGNHFGARSMMHGPPPGDGPASWPDTPGTPSAPDTPGGGS